MNNLQPNEKKIKRKYTKRKVTPIYSKFVKLYEESCKYNEEYQKQINERMEQDKKRKQLMTSLIKSISNPKTDYITIREGKFIIYL
jgi:hypothetical protein